MGQTERAFIALGSNLGDRLAFIQFALSRLAATSSIRLVAVSPFIETPPVGPAGQGPYINAAAAIDTSLGPRQVLDQLLAIEREAGRQRGGDHQRWGPRTLDLDLLLWGDHVIDEPGLTVPHPRMHERAFVLAPLAAIAPERPHPVLGTAMRELLASLSDRS